MPRVSENVIPRAGGGVLIRRTVEIEVPPGTTMLEAESLMQEFQSHPAFVELMSSFKTMFGGDMTETEMARAQGDDNNVRLSLVRERLRKKLAAKKNARK